VLDKHPIDYALQNCYSIHRSQAGSTACLAGAEAAWDAELNRVYLVLGGSSNKTLRTAQLAWIKFRDAQFEWFKSAFYKKSGSKWASAVASRRLQVVRQQVEHLQSYYKGY
jgi:uncharacterized protein YecT (DUF1311 family)